VVAETSEVQGTTTSSPGRRLAAADVATLDATDRTILVKTGRGRFDREIRIRSHTVARRVAGTLGVLIAVVTIFWVRNAWAWFDPCGDVSSTQLCNEPSAWFRFPQFTLAVVGVITGTTIAAYLLRFAVVGRIWRGSHRAAVVHGSVVFLWLVVWAAGALTR
jgi:hypothetical protein